MVNEANPFRRPVRPHDLKFLDYGVPLPEDEALRLSGLLGHRMLRNIYDADLLFVPGGPAGHPSRDDADAFYSLENRIRGRQAAEVLESHLFSWLPEARQPLEGDGVQGAKAHVLAQFERRLAGPGQALAIANATRRRKDAATFALVQLTAARPAITSAVGRSLVGDYDTAHPALRGLLLEDFQSRSERAAAYHELLGQAELIGEPYAYWQFFLSSTLAGANHLHRVGRDHERFLEFLGAWVHHRIDEAATAPGYGDLFREGFGIESPAYALGTPAVTADGLGALVEALLAPLAGRLGEEAVTTAFHAGFEDARLLAAVADRDLAVQLDWADRLDEYKAKAEKLHHRIESENIEVDLETFVESWEETSTTHVHDDHRLVVVEVGQMYFWNNVGQQIPMNEGDKLLIPAERLHGSMVRTGTCTYHQPVIPEDMLRSV
ncbi:hypothetical protein AB0M39_09940 [Streptomyces sp. NPDC051907]|uniref:hypothetical protein n=1 Tax=Streptomyces sp. NPDC051907 TaxID=3155284 RepID=UPI0034322FEE